MNDGSCTIGPLLIHSLFDRCALIGHLLAACVVDGTHLGDSADWRRSEVLSAALFMAIFWLWVMTGTQNLFSILLLHLIIFNKFTLIICCSPGINRFGLVFG